MVFIDVWPDHDISSAARTFAAQSSPVFELYIRGLHAGEKRIAATTSWCRFVLTDQPVAHRHHTLLGPDFAVITEEPPDSFGLSDGGWARFDPALIALPPADRGPAYLDWLHQRMVRLAELRGWDRRPLEDARQYCLDRSVEARFDGPRRQSPDRRHTAALSLHIDPDGLRHVALTVRNRAREVITARTTTARPFFCDFHDWRSVQRQVRWLSPTMLSVGDEYSLPYLAPLARVDITEPGVG
ncbi:hypothetical protein GCM10009818_29690 [Nakamurella flavida]